MRVCCDSDGVNVLKYETISHRFWDLIQTLLSLSHFYGILPAANMIQSTQQKILPFIIPPHLGENIFFVDGNYWPYVNVTMNCVTQSVIIRVQHRDSCEFMVPVT